MLYEYLLLPIIRIQFLMIPKMTELEYWNIQIESHLLYPTYTHINLRVLTSTLTYEIVINMSDNIVYVIALCKSKVLYKDKLFLCIITNIL